MDLKILYRSKYICSYCNLYIYKFTGFKFSEFSVSLKENSTLNKSTNVLVITYHNIDSLHDILAHLLIQFPFQTRKGTDFYYWCIVLYMHKFGYIYLALKK